MPHRHNWIRIASKTYLDYKKVARLMVLYRCSICGKEKFSKEKV